MRRAIATALVGVTLVACGGAPAAAPQPPARTGGASVATPSPAPPSPATTATVELASGGSFTIAFRADKAPNTVANFTKKARAGFYDGLSFHRVVPGFVAQGGDPYSKSGAGQVGTGGGQQPTELSDLPFTKGAVGVARGGDIKVSNDSQWFVCLEDAPHLNGAYANFGTVTKGMDVVQGIRVGDRIRTIRVD